MLTHVSSLRYMGRQNKEKPASEAGRIGGSRFMPVQELRDGAAMAYADEGEGPAIILVHGWAADGRFFSDLSQRLSRTHRVLTPTLRAHPGSETGSAPLTIETLAQDIVEFVQALDLKSFTALGWSMGAMALWAAAPLLDSRLAALIVEDMGPRLTNDDAWTHGLSGYGAADVPNTLAEVRADWPSYVSRFAPRMFSPSIAASRPELIAWAAAEMSKAEPEAMASFWASMAEQDFRSSLARIPQPMLVISGRESQVYPDGATAFIAHTAPNAKRIAITGAGHVPHLEAPDLFFQHVEAFVREQRRNELKRGAVT
jgi:pimeloyl-ACP methyl ester carboxylesterase